MAPDPQWEELCTCVAAQALKASHRSIRAASERRRQVQSEAIEAAKDRAGSGEDFEVVLREEFERRQLATPERVIRMHVDLHRAAKSPRPLARLRALGVLGGAARDGIRWIRERWESADDD